MLEHAVATLGSSSDLACTVADANASQFGCSYNTGTNNFLVYGRYGYSRRAYLKFGDLTATGSRCRPMRW